MRRFVEDHASIDIGLLKRRGLFKATSEQKVLVDTLAGPMEVTCQQPATHLTVQLGPTGKPAVQQIALQTTKLRLGDRVYFVCPISGGRASRLYLVDGQLASRIGHGLVNLSTTNRKTDAPRGLSINLANQLRGDGLGKGPARGARREKLITRLLAVKGNGVIDPEAQRIVDKTLRAQNDREAIFEKRRRALSHTTGAALERGRTSAMNWTEVDVLRQLAEPLAAILAGCPPEIPVIDWYPEHLYPKVTLDVRVLNSAGLFVPGELKGAALIWDRVLNQLIHYTLVAADFRDPERPYLLIENVDPIERKTYQQFIPLRFVADRWYMLCPFRGSRHTILYMRGRWLGSERALNLKRKPWDYPPLTDEAFESPAELSQES